MAVTKMSVSKFIPIVKKTENLFYLSVRNLYLPCKTTSNKTATWSNSKLPKSETSLTENVKLISLKPAASDNRNQQEKPLVVVLEWLMAKKKHTSKFADLYLDRGFDVLSVNLRPWQLIWPMKGSQPVAGSLLDILYDRYAARPILIHGFSVGGYLWGEVQLKMSQDLAKYEQLIQNITGAIWDSAVDINETAIGVPTALFPKNAMLRKACTKYILYHMKMFEKEATQHWRRSRDFFYRPVVRCPALLLFSATDPIGNPQSYAKVRASYEDMGIQIFEKCWDKSPHVAHFAFHKDEYVAQMEMFLESIGLLAARKQHIRAAAN